MKVKVAALPGVVREVQLPDGDGATVQQALVEYGRTTGAQVGVGTGQDIRLNGSPVSDLAEFVPVGAIITIVGQVRGGG